MPHALTVAVTLALLQGAPAPAPVVPSPTVAQPAPAAPVQPTPPTLPAQPAPAAQPYAQPAPPAQPYAQPAQPAQPYAQPAQPAQPYAQPYAQPAPPAPPGQPYPPAQPGQPYPPAQAYPYGQPYYPPPYPYYPYPPPNTTPTPPGNLAEGPASVPESVSHRKLVFANFYTLNFSIFSPIPSGDFTFFLGTNLRPRKNRARSFDWNTALGYQISLSVGLADVPTFSLASDGEDFFTGFFIHRHHLTAMGYGGSKQRLFYSFGGGVMFNYAELAGIEGEGRLGYVFTPAERRIKGVVGAQARLTSAFSVPLLQLGPFVGFMAF